MGRWEVRQGACGSNHTSQQASSEDQLNRSLRYLDVGVWSSVNHTLVEGLSFSLHSQSTVSELYHTEVTSWYWSIGKDLDFHSLDTEYVILMGEMRVQWAFHISNLNTQWNMKVWRFCCCCLFLTTTTTTTKLLRENQLHVEESSVCSVVFSMILSQRIHKCLLYSRK